jgi:hypothetical protein
MAMVGRSADPGIDHEATGNAVVRGLIVPEFDGVRGWCASDGMRHVHGEGLVLRTEAAEGGL